MGLTKLRAAGTAGIMALTLLLTACGGDAAEPVAANSTAASTAASSAADDSSSAMTSEDMSEDMTEDSTEEMSSEDMTEDTEGATSATTTVGGNSGDLDEPTTEWFDTLCTGLVPLTELGSAIGTGVSSSNDPASLKTLGDALISAGASFTQTATDLDGLEPPTFDGGAEFADKMVPGLTELGTLYTDIGTKVGAGDLSALDSMATSVEGGPLADLAAIDATPELKAAVAAIPSCSQLGMS